jgi:hypothetical protein
LTAITAERSSARRESYPQPSEFGCIRVRADDFCDSTSDHTVINHWQTQHLRRPIKSIQVPTNREGNSIGDFESFKNSIGDGQAVIKNGHIRISCIK